MHTAILALALALQAGKASSEANERLSRTTALYDQVCLKAFPDDRAVEAMMTAMGAKPLSQEAVKVTMRDDPARAWELADGSATVWIEFPPFHACSVRWNTPELGDLREYRTFADRFENATGGYVSLAPYDADMDDIHIHAVGEQRRLPDGRTESLFVFDQHVTDAKRRAAGETGFSMRFVHQFAPPRPQ